jgi:hypothetical protein
MGRFNEYTQGLVMGITVASAVAAWIGSRWKAAHLSFPRRKCYLELDDGSRQFLA